MAPELQRNLCDDEAGLGGALQTRGAQDELAVSRAGGGRECGLPHVCSGSQDKVPTS